MPHHFMSREFICDALGLAGLSITTIIVLWLPAILQA